MDKFKKECWDVEHVDSQNDATLQEYEDRLRWLKNVKFILGMEHTDRAKDLAQKCQDMIIEFTDRTKVNVDKYREFYQLINKYLIKVCNKSENRIQKRQLMYLLRGTQKIFLMLVHSQ